MINSARIVIGSGRGRFLEPVAMKKERVSQMQKLTQTVGILMPMLLGWSLCETAMAQRLNERTIPLENSQTRITLYEANGPEDRLETFFEITRNGQTQTRVADYTLKLRYGNFDPLTDSPEILAPSLTSGEEQNMYIVQFVTQPLKEYRSAITQLGGQVYFFMANHAHLVRLKPSQVDEVRNLPFVRWVGPYHPAYRLEELMLENEIRGIKTPMKRYNIMIMDSALGMKADIASRIQKIGGQVAREDAGKYLLEAILTHDQLMETVGWDEILFIDIWSPYEKDMDLARQIGGGDFLETMEGLTGEGVRGEILDLGFNMNHRDFDHHPLIEHTPVSVDSHGAACAGINFADGTGDIRGRGMMPMGQGIVADWDEASVGQTRYNHTGELAQEPYNAVFQTASVGSARTRNYTTISADTDAALFDFGVLHCQSQSNAGNQDSRPQAWAKNILSGGGIRHQNTLDRSDDCWCNGASIGPATDGRIKPDLASFYDGIFTTTTGGPAAYTSSFGGTSGATPIIAGHAGLVFEMWHRGLLGNTPDPNATVFENRAKMTTVKALLINTAFRYPFTGQNHDLTRVHQGWGMPDLENLYNLRDKLIVIDETDLITNMATNSYTANVLPGEPTLNITMIFADPPGVPSASQHRINDLSLKVTSPSGTVYWGNNGLLDGNFSTPDGTANEVDTVENVFIENPETGAWSVDVIATEINQDSHVETPALDADYALVITGGIQGPAFGIDPTPSNQEICAPADAVIELDIVQLLGFDEEIALTVDDLPAGATAMFSNTSVNAPTMVTLTISNLAAVTPGDYTISVTGTATSLTKVVFVTLRISNAIPDKALNLLPANGASEVALMPMLNWNATNQTLRYQLEVSQDPNFNNILVSETLETNSYQFSNLLDRLTCYYWRVRGENGCGMADWAISAFTTQDQPDYLTELFTGGFDLANTTLTLTPDGSGNYYGACITDAAAFPTDPTGGTAISLTDDDSESISPAQAVNFYGTDYASIFVGSNGFITFTSGSTTTGESLAAHFNQERLSFLFDDLNPAAGGTVTWKDEGDRTAITFDNVPEFNTSNSNNVQVEFFHNGTIQITWLAIDSGDNLVGLSRGGGVPPDFLQNDFSATANCGAVVINPGMGGCVASVCNEDLNNDNDIDVNDLLICAANWNHTSGPIDLNGDGVINILDMIMLMDAYGTCAPPPSN